MTSVVHKLHKNKYTAVQYNRLAEFTPQQNLNIIQFKSNYKFNNAV